MHTNIVLTGMGVKKMALTRCPECGHEMSSSAPVCPNCGYSFLFATPNRSQAKRNLIVFALGVIVPIIVGSGAFIAITIGGFVLEVVVSLVTMVITLLTGSKAVRIVLLFIFFDLGYALGGLLSFFIR